MRRALLLLGLALLLVSPLAAFAGETVVYHSPDDSGNPVGSSPWILPIANGEELHLYLTYDDPGGGASTTGTLCVDANGDETCGFDVRLEMETDGAVFQTFTPASAAVVGHIASPTTFRVNGLDIAGLDVTAPGGAQVVPIGTLTVDAAAASQLTITATGMHRVGAAGQLEAIQDQLIALPEPGGLAPLACGALSLRLLARRRRRGTGAR